MVRIIEDISVSERKKNVITCLEEVMKKLKTIKENLEFDPDKYDLDNLVDILCQIHDDIGDFAFEVSDNSTSNA